MQERQMFIHQEEADRTATEASSSSSPLYIFPGASTPVPQSFQRQTVHVPFLSLAHPGSVPKRREMLPIKAMHCSPALVS
jgi:hypothetical protein